MRNVLILLCLTACGETASHTPDCVDAGVCSLLPVVDAGPQQCALAASDGLPVVSSSSMEGLPPVLTGGGSIPPGRYVLQAMTIYGAQPTNPPITLAAVFVVSDNNNYQLTSLEKRSAGHFANCESSIQLDEVCGDGEGVKTGYYQISGTTLTLGMEPGVLYRMERE